MRLLVGLFIAALLVIGGAGGFVYSGVYDIAATDQHTAPVFWLLKTAMRRGVLHHARDIAAPSLGDPAQVALGRTLYDENCMRCHGAPGVAPEPFALGLRPLPANLANTGIEWPAPQLYWTIKHGLKLTAMPAWEFRLHDDELWAIVAYVQRLPYEPPRAYREARLRARAESLPRAARREGDELPRSNPLPSMTGDPVRGRHVMQQYGCVTCHEIPGIVGASAPVGPPLDRMATHSFIGGVLENTPQNMVRWLRAPEQFVPDGAMPNLGVREQDARDMAAYLDTLR
jgi:mono/diheme cytochrome c family protein